MKTVVAYFEDDQPSANTSKLIDSIIGTNVGVIIYKNVSEFAVKIMTHDPENIILFDESLALELFEHKENFKDIAYNIREAKVVGRKRKLLVIPSNLRVTKLEIALDRLSELI